MTASPIDRLTTELLTVEVSGDTSHAHVIVTGEIDSSSAPTLRQHLDALLDGDVRAVTVDLTAVTFLDSAGLCVLAGAHRRSAGQDVRLHVLASSRAVVRPLQITGLWQLLHAEQIEPEAGSAA
ncbi:MAG: STAS domain-containing protein [Blastococcus sp.]